MANSSVTRTITYSNNGVVTKSGLNNSLKTEIPFITLSCCEADC